LRRLLSYRDAVVLLGGESALTAVLDRASSVALLGLGAIDLIDARAEVVKLADGLIRGLRDKLTGLSRHDRTERLVAAHAVIVITAYFEVLGEVAGLPRLTRDDQEHLVRQGAPGHWVEVLAGADLPIPGPQRAYEDVAGELAEVYRGFSTALLRLLTGLACWDEWDETRRDRVGEELTDLLPGRALVRQQELFRRLAADFPEVAFWCDRLDHTATRAELRNLSEGLSRLREQLASTRTGAGPSDRLEALVRANRAVLDRPIVSAADVPAGMAIPSLGHAYVDHRFRVLPDGPDRKPAEETQWQDRPLRADLSEFMAGHLTLPQATHAPLLVLGQPGAGKSVLTKILAARLTAGDFLPLRVELRAVPADSDVPAQIEHAIRDALDEAVSWAELAHAARGSLPVVMLDGFDELLQATGVNQADYLERVAGFQRRQAERGRPLAVIVTSRTAVAGRARLPSGTVALRLEPFDEEQVARWAAVWNAGNEAYFAGRGLEPLRVADALAVPQLASQPLLLLMLALYDADANALRQAGGDLSEAELYERLLLGFAEREVRKSGDALPDADIRRAVEEHLLRLSVTAFAMFNRSHQWVIEEDLDADLHAMFGPARGTREPFGFRRRLTPAEDVIGGFFFVHRTQALRDEQRLRTYEFLHATFGEYLVARLVVRELADLAAELASAASRNRPTAPDDSFLHALLSFAVLTVRAPIVDFLGYGLRHRIPAERRALLADRLCAAFAGSQQLRAGSAYDAYQPVAAGVPARHSAYGANLLLLAVLAADGPLSGTRLFGTGDPGAANEGWRRMARLWHSQLARDEWATLIGTIRVRHAARDGHRTMTVHLDHGEPFEATDLVFMAWPQWEGAVDHYRQTVPAGAPHAKWFRETSFRDDSPLGHLLLNLLPYMTAVDHRLDDLLGDEQRLIVPATDLLTLLLSPMTDVEHRVETYRTSLAVTPSDRYLELVLRQLEEDAPRLPPEAVMSLLVDSEITGVPSLAGRVAGILKSLGGRPGLDPELHAKVMNLVRIEQPIQEKEG
jgi:hypothetical protein